MSKANNKKRTFSLDPLSDDEEKILSQKLEETSSAAPHASSGGSAIGKLTAKTSSNLKKISDELQMAKKEIEELRNEGDGSVKKIDTKKILLSPYANRHNEEIYEDKDFLDLVESIKNEGQTVPGLVRPHPKDKGMYEVVFGHRRFAACKELGIPYLAQIKELDDSELVFYMARENALRKNVAPFSLCEFWQTWLDRGWVSSIRDISEKAGVSKTQVSRILSISKLPDWMLNGLLSKYEISLIQWSRLISSYRQLPYNKKLDLESLFKDEKTFDYVYLMKIIKNILDENNNVEKFSSNVIKGVCRGDQINIKVKDPFLLNEILSFIREKEKLSS